MEHKFHFHIRVHSWAEILSMTKIWVLRLLLWWNPVERGVSLPDTDWPLTDPRKPMQSSAGFSLPRKTGCGPFARSQGWQCMSSVCVCVQKMVVLGLWEYLCYRGILHIAPQRVVLILLINLVQQLYTVFLPIWGYPCDASAGRYRK